MGFSATGSVWEALQALADAKEIWQDGDPSRLARASVFAGKRKRLCAESARRVLAAFETLGIDPATIKDHPRESFMAASAAIDARLDYGEGGRVAGSGAGSADDLADSCDAGPGMRTVRQGPAARPLRAFMERPEVRERYLSISLEDDRKRKGRRVWLGFDELSAFMARGLACRFESAGRAHDGASGAAAASGTLALQDAAGPEKAAFEPNATGEGGDDRFPWVHDLALRAHYLRAQHCLMRAFGPCAFDPALLVGFVEDPASWAKSRGIGWIEEHPLPALSDAAARVCGASGGDVAARLRAFAAAWDAYQAEVQRVFCLWKGWKGPRATAVAQRDYGLEMLVAYADLLDACQAASPLVERMDGVIAAFSRIAECSGAKRAFGASFLPALDPVAPEERERRRLQSEAALAARGRNRKPEFDARPVVYEDDEPYYVYGSIDDYIHNPWRYSPDFFERNVPWEQSNRM